MKQMTVYPKRLFLIDGLGAVLSAFFLGGVLTRFQAFFGMPKSVLYVLASVACLFAIYSFFCHLIVGENSLTYLKTIAIANSIYVCITVVLLLYFFERLTALGFVYFILELIVLGFFIRLEVKTIAKIREAP